MFLFIERGEISSQLKREKIINLLYNEEIARTSFFFRAADIDFNHLAGPRNVSVDSCSVD